MRFIDLYEADNNKNEKFVPANSISDAIQKDNKDIVTFFKRIKSMDDPQKFKIYLNDTDSKVISLKEENNKTNTNDFNEFIKSLKNSFGDDYFNLISKNEDTICNNTDSKTKNWFINPFFKLLKNSGLEITNSGKIKDTKEIRSSRNNSFGNERAYETLGKALVFYSAKFMSYASDENTDLKNMDPEQFMYIMQGCFGETSQNGNENDSFWSGENKNILLDLGGIKAKMTIDAAKSVISKKSNNTTNDQGYVGYVDESKDYYEQLRLYLNILTESDDSSNNTNQKYDTPLQVSDFSDDVETAYNQALTVKNAHPREFDIEFKKLQKAFNDGLDDYREKLRNIDTTDGGTIENPITGQKEKIKHSGFGTGGPNAFIRKNPTLAKLVSDIKGQQLNIFNMGAKAMLLLFDAIEKGGNIFQSLCDDISKSWKDFNKLISKLKPDEVNHKIETMLKKEDRTGAATTCISAILAYMSGVYRSITENPHLEIKVTQHAISTIDDKRNASEPIIKDYAEGAEQVITKELNKVIKEYKVWKETVDGHNGKSNNQNNNQEQNEQETNENIIHKTFKDFLFEDEQQNDNKLKTTLDLKKSIVFTDAYLKSVKDLNTKAKNLVDILEDIGNPTPEEVEAYLSGEKTDVEYVKDNNVEKNESIINPINIKYLKEEDEGSFDELDNDDNSNNNSDNKTDDNKENKKSENIEVICTNNNPEGVKKYAEFISNFTNFKAWDKSELNNFYEKTSKPETINEALDKFVKYTKSFLDAIKDYKNLEKLENQVIGISNDEDSKIQKIRNSNIVFEYKKIAEENEDKDDDENEENNSGLTSELTAIWNQITTYNKGVFEKVINKINQIKIDEKDATAAETETNNLLSFSEETNKQVVEACKKMQESWKKFLQKHYPNQSEQIKKFDELFTYCINGNIQDHCKIIYFVNILNLIAKILFNITNNSKTEEIQKLNTTIKEYINKKSDNTSFNTKEIADGRTSIDKHIDIEIIKTQEGESVKKEAILPTIGNIIEGINKLKTGLVALFPNEQNDALYWYLALDKSKELQDKFKELVKTNAITYMGIKQGASGRSITYFLKYLTGDASKNTNELSKYPKLVELIKAVQPDHEKLEKIGNDSNTINIIGALDVYYAIFKKIEKAIPDLEEEGSLTVVYANPNNKGNVKPGEIANTKKAQTTDNTAATKNNNEREVISNSYIPEISNDMFINEIYNLIRNK